LTIIFQLFLTLYWQSFAIFFVSLLNYKFSLFSINALSMGRLWIKLSVGALFRLITLNFFICLFFFLKYLSYLLVEILKETIESKIFKSILAFHCHYLLIGFGYICEFFCCLRSWVIFWVIFDGQISIGFFYLVFCSVFWNFQSFIRVELFLNFFRVVLLEEVFFFLTYSMLVEKPLKNIMRIIRFKSSHSLFIGHWNSSCSKSDWWFEHSGKEKWIVEVKEWSKESSSHWVFLII
jgi:hypothetical protein